MGSTIERDEPITLCAVLNGLRQQRVKNLSLSYESHLGEVVEISVSRSKGSGGEVGDFLSSVSSATAPTTVINVAPHSNS